MGRKACGANSSCDRVMNNRIILRSNKNFPSHVKQFETGDSFTLISVFWNGINFPASASYYMLEVDHLFGKFGSLEMKRNFVLRHNTQPPLTPDLDDKFVTVEC